MMKLGIKKRKTNIQFIINYHCDGLKTACKIVYTYLLLISQFELSCSFTAGILAHVIIHGPWATKTEWGTTSLWIQPLANTGAIIIYTTSVKQDAYYYYHLLVWHNYKKTGMALITYKTIYTCSQYDELTWWTVHYVAHRKFHWNFLLVWVCAWLWLLYLE